MDAATSHSVKIGRSPYSLCRILDQLIIHGPLVGGTYRVPLREEAGLLDRIQDAVGDKNIDALYVQYACLSEKTLRYLFGAFHNLGELIVSNMPYYRDDWLVLAAQLLRGKPLKKISLFECNVGIAGARALAELVEATPRLSGFSMYHIQRGLGWTREEALLLARLVETHTGERFLFGNDLPPPVTNAIDRAVERAWYCKFYHGGAKAREIVEARYKVLAILPPSAGTPLARLLAKDGDHALALRVLAMLGGNVVFDATTVEEAYDACVLRVEVGVV